MLRRRRFKRGSWGELFLLCQRFGKDSVLKALEAIHAASEGAHAFYAAEPEHWRKARMLQVTITKQQETIIRLRNMSQEDIDKALEAHE